VERPSAARQQLGREPVSVAGRGTVVEEVTVLEPDHRPIEDTASIERSIIASLEDGVAGMWNPGLTFDLGDRTAEHPDLLPTLPRALDMHDEEVALHEHRAGRKELAAPRLHLADGGFGSPQPEALVALRILRQAIHQPVHGPTPPERPARTR